MHMEAKESLNVEYLEIDPTLLQNPENLLNPYWVYNSGRQFMIKLLSFYTYQNNK